jgi:hypothetical protein
MVAVVAFAAAVGCGTRDASSRARVQSVIVVNGDRPGVQVRPGTAAVVMGPVTWRIERDGGWSVLTSGPGQAPTVRATQIAERETTFAFPAEPGDRDVSSGPSITQMWLPGQRARWVAEWWHPGSCKRSALRAQGLTALCVTRGPRPGRAVWLATAPGTSAPRGRCERFLSVCTRPIEDLAALVAR